MIEPELTHAHADSVAITATTQEGRMTIAVDTAQGSVPISLPPGSSMVEQVAMVQAVSALAKLSGEQRRIVIEAIRQKAS
jgi:hypothetical protein